MTHPLPAPLSDRLRTATAAAHARLESSLDLLAPPVSVERIGRLLEGFHGFHAVSEPAMARHPRLHAMVRDRERLTHLRDDLLRLGRTGAQMQSLPLCSRAGLLAAESDQALGAFYVLEGSTLGGRLISRALAETPMRAVGLRYFDPYGEDTGRRWRAFKAWLDGEAAHSRPAMVERGAVATFDLLTEWLEPARR